MSLVVLLFPELRKSDDSGELWHHGHPDRDLL